MHVILGGVGGPVDDPGSRLSGGLLWGGFPVWSGSLTWTAGLWVRLGHRLVDDYLEFLATRARPNTVLAYAFDLKVFFGVVGKEPAEMTSGDVLAFIVENPVFEDLSPRCSLGPRRYPR